MLREPSDDLPKRFPAREDMDPEPPRYSWREKIIAMGLALVAAYAVAGWITGTLRW